jgi:uncharacterized protein YecE (DUF72 family)
MVTPETARHKYSLSSERMYYRGTQNMKVKVGTCGFSASQKKIFENLDVVELQQTFYDPPPTTYLRRLREKAPQGFEFTVKAWMLITHKYSRMLWKRLKRSVPGRMENYGFFQDTEEVWWAWEETRRAARDVNAQIIIFQSPASFKPTDDNLSNLNNFFKRISKEGFILGWEPRGEWWDRPDLLKELSMKYNITIIGDYLRGRLPPIQREISYTRLHGLGGKEVNYKYKYTDEDLNKLWKIIYNIKSKEIYVLFNNVYSYEDALRFKTLAKTAI